MKFQITAETITSDAPITFTTKKPAKALWWAHFKDATVVGQGGKLSEDELYALV